MRFLLSIMFPKLIGDLCRFMKGGNKTLTSVLDGGGMDLEIGETFITRSRG